MARASSFVNGRTPCLAAIAVSATVYALQSTICPAVIRNAGADWMSWPELWPLRQYDQQLRLIREWNALPTMLDALALMPDAPLECVSAPKE